MKGTSWGAIFHILLYKTGKEEGKYIILNVHHICGRSLVVCQHRWNPFDRNTIRNNL